MTLVIVFDTFTGRLTEGYLMRRGGGPKIGNAMTPTAVLAYLAENPETHCTPIKV